MADPSLEYARSKDAEDPLRTLRQEFHIPTRGQLRSTTLDGKPPAPQVDDDEPSTYLCGNSLGLQPRLTAQYTAAYHQTWATKGVYGHFKEVSDSPLQPWLHVDDDVTLGMSRIVGCSQSEVAVMQTLTANLHIALSSFYRPTAQRHKIIIESKAFPSDHYAIESQIQHHNLDPSSSMIAIEPSLDSPTPILTTEHILSTISAHADSTAVLLLPGIQFYTGQLLDIPRITAFAHSHSIVVGWDLAHAVGNVPLALHEWSVDFAVWCTYKYLNSGPGSAGGLFIHARHHHAPQTTPTHVLGQPGPRLAGWWGSSKTSRFAMSNRFEPIPGAAGWQLSNPSVADLTAVRASLDVFAKTDMQALRAKSVALTGYLQALLEALAERQVRHFGVAGFRFITPLDEVQRGAQLSLAVREEALDGIMEVLEERGVVVDERRPDVIRVAPAPLYNGWEDVWRFVGVFEEACGKMLGGGTGPATGGGTMAVGAEGAKGWSEVK